jgi:polar amino acid transport system substrate-binding protein
MLTRGSLLLALALGLCVAACSDLPRDPQQTLRRAQANGRLRVGLVEHPPWVVRGGGGEPAGAEVELVREFARELGATPEWRWGGEQEQMEALEQYQLDAVVGGLTSETAWSKYVGLTSPYFESRIVVGVPRTQPPLGSVKGVQVSARSGDPSAGYLKSKGATVAFVEDVSKAGGAVAAPDWQLERLGLTLTDVELHTEKHVMAVPPGENALIKRLDEFLYRERSQVRSLLQQEDAKR